MSDPRGPVVRRVPTVNLGGPAEARYVHDVARILRASRLNTYYPDARRLASHVRCLHPDVHRGLYGGVEVDIRSGLPSYKEWVRVQTDSEIREQSLKDMKPREELERLARKNPASIHGKQLLKIDYYTDLAGAKLASPSHMDVALRRVEPEKNRAYFHAILDKLDGTGTFIRFTIDLSQQSSVWNRPMMTLDEETAGHTQDFKSLIYKFTSLDAEFTFAKLVTMGGLTIERVVKGTVGPFYFTGMKAPAPIAPMLAAEDGFVATFGLDMAACDLAKDRDNDPIEDLVAEKLSEDARQTYEDGRQRYGYKVFKDRKFVTIKPLVGAIHAYCKAAGTRNMVYAVRG